MSTLPILIFFKTRFSLMCAHSRHGNLISDPLYEINGVSCDYHCYAFIFSFVIEIFFENKKKYLGRSFSSSKSVKRKSYTKWNIWNTELSKLSNLWNVWAVWSETRNKWNKRSKSRWRVSTIIYPKQIFGDAIPFLVTRNSWIF